MPDRESMGYLLRLAIRVLVLIVGWTVYNVLVNWIWTEDQQDANIGAGLLAFGLVLVVAVLGGFIDGRRYSLGATVGTWALAGALLGVFATLFIAFEDGQVDWSVFRSDVVGMVPFFGFLVAIPAMIGGIFGSASSGQTTADSH